MTSSPNSPPVVLVVDDHPTNIDLLYHLLSREGYDTRVAENGRSALARIETVKPDIVLLDIMMPDIDGFDTCQRLKDNPSTADIPVIFITALTEMSDKLRGFQTGAVDYITKPFHNQEVLARVRTQLSLKQMREDLQTQNQQLRAQNQSLEAYARTVAHDLKNPLHLILNLADFIRDDANLAGQPLKDLLTLRKSAMQMNHIIHDLLLLSQVRKDKVRPAPVHMENTVQQSLDRLRLDIEEAQAEINLPHDWPTVLGRSAWIQAVWVNYLSNALKYGGTPPHISLHHQPDPQSPGMIRFSVRDNGPGIPPEHQQDIFEEFSRIEGSNAEGHGIGLATCQRIITRLGGQVGVQNLPNSSGCSFFFTLPEAPTK